MPRYIDNRREAVLFVNGSLEDLLPIESIARIIWAALERLDFGAFDALYRNDAHGRPAVDPRRLVAVWILAILRGCTSSVALAERCARDIEFRWLLGDAPVKKSTLSDFRKRQSEALADLITQVLALLGRAGLLRGETAVLDGTIVRAAASCEASRSREQLEAQIARLQKRIAREVADPQEDTARQALEARQEGLKETLEEMTRLGLTGPKDRYTRTEPDASYKKLKHGGYAPAHNVQVVCDAASGAIVTATVVPQGNDQGQLEGQLALARAQLARVAQRMAQTPEAAPGPLKQVAADGAYHDRRQLAHLTAEGIEAVVPDGQAQREAPGVTPDFKASAFPYDAATDTLVCPEGQRLKPVGANPGGTATRYRAPGAVCQSCPHKTQCCPKATKGGRMVNRPLAQYAEAAQAAARRVQSPEGQRLLHARQVTSEGTFARLLDRLGWRRCRTWGAPGAQMEACWHQLTVNLMLWMGHWKPLVFKTA